MSTGIIAGKEQVIPLLLIFSGLDWNDFLKETSKDNKKCIHNGKYENKLTV